MQSSAESSDVAPGEEATIRRWGEVEVSRRQELRIQGARIDDDTLGNAVGYSCVRGDRGPMVIDRRAAAFLTVFLAE